MYLRTYLQVQIVQLNEDKGEFEHKLTFDHPYPTTKINWIPDLVGLLLACGEANVSLHMHMHVHVCKYVCTYFTQAFVNTYVRICTYILVTTWLLEE